MKGETDARKGERTDDRRSRGSGRSRRAFLAGAGAAGLTALAGCTVSVNENGITWGGDDGSTGSPDSTTGRRPTTTTTPDPTTTPNPATTTTTTPDPTTTQEFELVTVEPEPPEYVIGDPVTTTAEPESVTARFALQNFRLYVSEANDGTFEGPKTLELFGTLSAAGFPDAGTELEDAIPYSGQVRNDGFWQTGGSESIQVKEGERARRISTKTDPILVDFPEFQDLDPGEAFIEVWGFLRDADNAGSPEDYGRSSFRWYLDMPQSGGATADRNGEAKYKFSFNDHGASIRISFDVDRIR